jgi:hypothetical protein
VAELERPEVRYRPGCPDCGERRIRLPEPLPAVGDDFDWRARDYDGFQRAMLGELAARSPERARWTPADIEVVLVEALAAVLDQLSDTLDRVTAEAYLETARRPESVRRLLELVGHDAVRAAGAAGLINERGTGDEQRRRAVEELEGLWLRRPDLMEQARAAGPRAIRTQRRMVTVADHATRCEEHPLVHRATAWQEWSGSWTTVKVAVIPHGGRTLDGPGDYEQLETPLRRFHDERGVPLPALSGRPSFREVLTPYIEAYRMVGQEVLLLEATRVPVTFSLSLRVGATYFRGEIRAAIGQALGTEPGGFFAPGRLRFGEDLWASDLIEAVMAVDGVESACLNRFKRLGAQYPDASEVGVIPLDSLDIAVCDNDAARPQAGYWRLTLHGGVAG